MTGQTIVLVGVIAYLALTLLVGFLAGRNVKEGEDFLVAGRKLPTWLCTFTVFATWFGAGTCLGAAGAAYQEGILGVIVDPFGAVLCLLLAGTFFFKPLRRLRFLTVGDYFRERYGDTTERAVALLLAPIYILWVASQLVAFGFVVKTITALSTTSSIILSTVIVLTYTAVGGMWAVAMTDFIQAFVLIGGLLYLLPVVWQQAGGWSQIVAKLPKGHLRFWPSKGALAWLLYCQAWLIGGLGDLPGQELMGRAMSAKDEDTARRSAYFAGFLYLTVGLIPVFLGMMGAFLVPGLAEKEAEYILLKLGLQYLPPIGMALFAGALISALMSSADSALLAQASLIVENVIRPYRPEMDGKAVLRYCRNTVVISGFVALFVALMAQKVFKLMILASAFGLVSLAAPFVMGFWWKGANEPGALSAMVLGFVSWGAVELWARVAYAGQDFPSFLPALVVSFATIGVVSKLTSEKYPPKALVKE